MKIYDCSLLFNELELLELRMMVLDDVVDYFVVVESDTTFVGNHKDLLFEKNKERFKKYSDKIIYVKVLDTPERTSQWSIERFQRNCINRGLVDAKPEDKILLCDIDEIPNPEIIKKFRSTPNPITFEQSLFYYYVNCLSPRKWNGPIMYPYGYSELTPQDYRWQARSGLNVVGNGGWHYSYLGGLDKVKYKLKNLTDADPETEIVIEQKHTDLKDMWSDEAYSIIDLEKNSAPHIEEWVKKYPAMFLEEE